MSSEITSHFGNVQLQGLLSVVETTNHFGKDLVSVLLLQLVILVVDVLEVLVAHFLPATKPTGLVETLKTDCYKRPLKYFP